MIRMLLIGLGLVLVLIGVGLAHESEDLIGKPHGIYDGDTFFIGDKKVRTLGYDTPEKHQKCKNADGDSYFCGEKAREVLLDFIGDKEVVCLTTGRTTYDRVLAHCVVEGKDIGYYMVREEWAFVDPRFTQRNLSAQKAAEVNKKGMWSGEFVFPWKWRDGERLQGE